MDLALRHKGNLYLVEMKSPAATWTRDKARVQAAEYAKVKKLREATLAVFIPTSKPEMLSELEEPVKIKGVAVYTVAFGWKPVLTRRQAPALLSLDATLEPDTLSLKPEMMGI